MGTRLRLDALWHAAMDAYDALACGKCGPHTERAIEVLRDVLNTERAYRASASERSEEEA